MLIFARSLLGVVCFGRALFEGVDIREFLLFIFCCFVNVLKSKSQVAKWT